MSSGNTFFGVVLIVIGLILFLIGARKRGALLLAELKP